MSTPDLDADIELADIPDDLPYIETGCFAEGPDDEKDIWTADFLAAAAPALAVAAAGEFAPLALAKIYGWIDPHYKTMKRSGIVGDARHLAGYHRSRQRLLNVGKSGDYSIQAPADKRGERWACCGIDISFGPAEMKIATRRLMNACRNKDPRIEPIREFFGTLDGKKVTGWNRYDTGRNVGYVTADSSHLWHVHISIFRDYADDEAKMRGVADVLNGVPLKPPPPPPKPKPEEKPTVTKATINLEDVKWIWTTQAFVTAGQTETDPDKKFWQPRTFLTMTFNRAHETLEGVRDLNGKADETLALLREIRDELKAGPEDPQP